VPRPQSENLSLYGKETETRERDKMLGGHYPSQGKKVDQNRQKGFDVRVRDCSAQKGKSRSQRNLWDGKNRFEQISLLAGKTDRAAGGDRSGKARKAHPHKEKRRGKAKKKL